LLYGTCEALSRSRSGYKRSLSVRANLSKLGIKLLAIPEKFKDCITHVNTHKASILPVKPDPSNSFKAVFMFTLCRRQYSNCNINSLIEDRASSGDVNSLALCFAISLLISSTVVSLM
jgi:hypothetical protein